MKNEKMIPRPLQALIATILMLASNHAERCGQFTLAMILIFLGSFIFGCILQGIRQEQAQR